MKSKLLIKIPIIFVIPSIYLIYACIVTIISINNASHEFGELYTQFLFNAVLQLFFAISILISIINTYLSLNFEKIKLQSRVFARLTLIISIVLIMIYLYGYYYIRFNLIGAWHMLFIGITVSTSVPIALLFGQLLLVIQKPKLNKA